MTFHRHLLSLFAALTLVAAVPAFGAGSLLTPEGVRYSIESGGDDPQLEIARAEGLDRARLIVPSTQDAVLESDAQIAYDSATGTLFVVWVREADGVGEIRYVRLSREGYWSTPRLVTAGAGSYRGMKFVLTHDSTGTVTLMHVAWWAVNGEILNPEYALFAFDDGHLVSAVMEDLNDLAGVTNLVGIADTEIDGIASHPPMALDRNGEDVDVAFGSTSSTAVTCLTVSARKMAGDVRIWKPVGRSGIRTPHSNLVASEGQPVFAYVNNGHLALYTIGQDFRFVVLKKDGTWSPVREVHIDADNTADDLLREFEKTVEELLDQEDDSDSYPSR